MSKELPYFKFHCEQWLGKKITLESFEMQGIFINVCAIYWANDCDIKIATLQKRYGQAIDYLIDEGFIKDKNGIAKISFLDGQWQERYKIHKENSNNGKAGAEARWAKHREANSVANSEAIKKGIAIREDKIKEDKKREDNIINIWFSDLENGSLLEAISMKTNLSTQLLKTKVKQFKKHADLSYPSYDKFVNHFKNWVILNPKDPDQAQFVC